MRGLRALAFDFTSTHGARALEASQVPFRNVYVLRRESESLPISEPLRGLDLTNDGDQRDTSNVFGVSLEDEDYSPLWQVVQVEVSDSYQGVDSFQDDGQSDYRDSAQMFVVEPLDYSITPVPNAIASFEETATFINCPLQSAVGAL